MCIIVVCTLINNEYAHYSFPNMFFLVVSACWVSLQMFMKRKVWRVQLAHLHNAVRAPSRLFQAKFSLKFKWFLNYNKHNFHILPMNNVIPIFVTCLVFLGMALSFIELTSSSGTLTKRVAATKKIRPPAIITSAEVIIEEFDAILSQ